MSEKFTNLARSTLASGITAGAASLTVQSGDGNDLFPVLGGSDNFRCVLFKKSTGDIEIINVTARSGDVFTIARAQEQIGNIAATAFAFDAGDLIELRPTSAFYTGLAGGSTSANVQSGTFLTGLDTGAADVYTVAMNPTAAALTSRQEVRVTIGAGNTNTGIAATLKLDALAAKSIKMEDGSNPPANSIRAGFVHTFIYNGTDFIFQSQGLALTSSGFNALGKQIKNVAAGTAATDVATIGGAETHTNKTFTSPVINTQVSGTAFLDEDSMASNSATKFCSQQSIKAYADNEVNNYAPNIGFEANGDAAQVITNGSTATLGFGTEIYDLGSNYNATTDEFTAPVDGVYLFSGSVEFNWTSPTSTNGMPILLYINGSSAAGYRDNTGSFTSSTKLYKNFSFLVDLTSGDDVLIKGTNNTGVTVTMVIGARNKFSCSLVQKT